MEGLGGRESEGGRAHMGTRTNRATRLLYERNTKAARKEGLGGGEREGEERSWTNGARRLREVFSEGHGDAGDSD